MTDLQIAQDTELPPIAEVTAALGLSPDDYEPYGRYKAKLTAACLDRLAGDKAGKLILVTAVNPTPAGEGKTTTAIGLADGLCRIGEKAVLALREPSLGPVMGVKGGATGGGYAQVAPMADINLHFTGDIHAVTSAHNLLCAMLDNHIKQGNALNVDVTNITLSRCMDANDRSLRNIVIGLGGSVNGVPRSDGFIITAASEVMAVLCLARDVDDLRARLGRIIVGYDTTGNPVTASQLNAQGAMTALLRDACLPNVVQTLDGNPCVMHGGPFANIAHGANSIRATNAALRLGDYCVTEAGFGSDLGAEKFMHITSAALGRAPDCVVLVATVRALKYNGGVAKSDLATENVDALRRGICNLEAHMHNMAQFGVPVVVTLNVFATDTQAELNVVRQAVESQGAAFALNHAHAEGGRGAVSLAKAVVEACRKSGNFVRLYTPDTPLADKLRAVIERIYGGTLHILPKAAKQLQRAEALGFGHCPVCIAKTQYSLSDDPTLLGRPAGFTVTVREILISAGAGFIVALTGDVMRMPGLPKKPAAENIDVDENGDYVGIF